MPSLGMPAVTAFAVVMAALIGVAGFGSGALAQQAQEGGFPEFSTYELFAEPDSVDPKPDVIRQLADAIRKAQAPGDCPLGRLKIRAPEGDPLFQASLAAARRDAVLAALNGLGVAVAGRLFAEANVALGPGGTDAVYEPALDKKAPKLKTESAPRKGTKVKAGDQIKVTMIARDDPAPWPTGIKTIQLVADSEDGRFIESKNYEPCAQPAERRVVATYTVPTNPPPIVRLTALAADHVGLMSTDVGEFPTKGDWVGTLEFSTEGVTSGVKLTIKDQMDIVLEYDGQGNLKGTLVGKRHFKQDDNHDPSLGPYYCSWDITIPNKLRGKLLGSYTPGAEVMSIQLVEPVVAPAPKKDCPGGGYIYSGDSIHDEPNFKSVLRSPKAAGKDVFRSSMEWVTGSYTNRISLTLRRVRSAGNP